MRGGLVHRFCRFIRMSHISWSSGVGAGSLLPAHSSWKRFLLVFSLICAQTFSYVCLVLKWSAHSFSWAVASSCMWVSQVALDCIASSKVMVRCGGVVSSSSNIGSVSGWSRLHPVWRCDIVGSSSIIIGSVSGFSRLHPVPVGWPVGVLCLSGVSLGLVRTSVCSWW